MNSISTISGIYIIKNLRNGKFYLGQTQNIRKRWNDHKSNLREAAKRQHEHKRKQTENDKQETEE